MFDMDPEQSIMLHFRILIRLSININVIITTWLTKMNRWRVIRRNLKFSVDTPNQQSVVDLKWGQAHMDGRAPDIERRILVIILLLEV